MAEREERAEERGRVLAPPVNDQRTSLLALDPWFAGSHLSSRGRESCVEARDMAVWRPAGADVACPRACMLEMTLLTKDDADDWRCSRRGKKKTNPRRVQWVELRVRTVRTCVVKCPGASAAGPPRQAGTAARGRRFVCTCDLCSLENARTQGPTAIVTWRAGNAQCALSCLPALHKVPETGLMQGTGSFHHPSDLHVRAARVRMSDK